MGLKGLFRMWPAWIISVVLLVLIYYANPQQLGVLLYKTYFITWGAIVGYWVDRWVFPYDRPHQSDDLTNAEKRRAWIVGVSMLAFALAV